MRDNFSKATKETLAKRVANRCSNPFCKKVTVGPNENPEKSTSIGIACHITAASKNGPRYKAELTPYQRKSIKNGIWLCSNCSALIDKDENSYPPSLLIEWKQQAEEFTKNQLLKNTESSEVTIKNKNVPSLKERILELLELQNPLALKLKSGYKRRRGGEIIETKEFIGKESFPQFKKLVEAVIRNRKQLIAANHTTVEKEIHDIFQHNDAYINYFNFNKQIFNSLSENKEDENFNFCLSLINLNMTNAERDVLYYFLIGKGDEEYIDLLNQLKLMENLNYENILYYKPIFE